MRKKILNDDDSREKFIKYTDAKLCKFCGDRPALANGYCSKNCAKKDEVWNWSS